MKKGTALQYLLKFWCMGKGLCYFPPTHCKPIFSRLVVGAKLTANIAHIPQSTMNFVVKF